MFLRRATVSVAALIVVCQFGCGASDSKSAATKKVDSKSANAKTNSSEPKAGSPKANTKNKTPKKDVASKPSEVKEGPEISFKFDWSKPSSGTVVAKRSLQRAGQPSLESKISYRVTIGPGKAKDHYRFSSESPKIDPLRATIPQDSLNQMLVGRLYLVSGDLKSDGSFSASKSSLASTTKELHTLIDKASSDARVPKQQRQALLATALPEKVLELVGREHWKSMVQSFLGKKMKVGVAYETEAPTELPLGGSVTFVSTLKVVEQKPAPDTGANCVRVEARSKPKGSMLKAIQKASPIPGATFEHFEMTIDGTQIVDPATLKPYLLKYVKTTNARITLPNGVTAPVKEVSTEEWRYSWNKSGAGGK